MYDIRMRTADRVIEVTLGGMLGLDEIERYIQDLRRTLIQHGLGANYAMVIDVSACPIQSQDTIVAMGQHMAHMPKARALAVVTGSSLAKMQIRRLFTQPYTRIVATIDQGRAWVLDGVEPLAA